MLDAIPDALVLTDLGGIIRWANETAERTFGYSRQELLGASLDTLLPPRLDDAQPVTDSMHYVDRAAVRKDGTTLPVELVRRRLDSVPGDLLLHVLRDVSGRKRADLARLLLTAIVDSSEDAILSTALDGTISSWNRGATRIFGYAAHEVVGRPFSILALDAATAGEQTAHFQRILRGEVVEPYQALRKRKDGSEVALSVRVCAIRDPRGALLGISSTARDLSEQRLATERARAVGQQLVSAVESFPGMFALFGPDQRIATCNHAFREFFGPALAGDMNARFSALVEKSAERGLLASSDVSPTQLAARWLELHASDDMLELRSCDARTLRVSSRVTEDGGLVCTLWDVTEDITREAELRRAHAAAQSASAAKSEFLASVSHELRTPLNAILGFAQLLARDKKAPLDARQRDRVAHIVKGGEHLLRLIEDVLDFARIEAGHVSVSLEAVGLGDLLREVTGTLEPMALQRNVRLSVEHTLPALPRVRADRVRAAQVLMNFGSNAIKYGNGGGIVRFRVSAERADTIRISVIDQGAGIALEQQSKLFQPFQRAGQELGSIEGTGIGLIICKRLATLMGGEVGFVSKPGVGSEFWLELPRHPGDSDARAPEKRATHSLQHAQGPATHTVVYIEDNPSNIALMQNVLEELGNVELVTAHTAEIGIDLVRARRPDVVLLDINLPGMSGIAAAEQLRTWPETHDIPMVALTAATLRERKPKDLTVFDRYLSKPLKVDELTEALSALFDRADVASLHR